MAKKKVFDLEARKELKDTKQVMDKAVDDLTNAVVSREQLLLENKVLKEQIEHLEELLLNAKNVPTIELKTHEEEIILVELKRMYDMHVIRNCPLVDKDDIKKLKILVESLSIIRNGRKPAKKKEDEMTIEEALSLVSDQVEK